jgi:glycosyltransferase involved in cell wall biosynthesis
LYVINAFEIDAPTQVTAAIARGLHASGWDVAVAAWSRDGIARAELARAGIQTRVLAAPRPIALARLIRWFQPDIVHSMLARPTLGTLLTRMFLAGGRFLWLFGDHGPHEWHERGRTLGIIMDRLMPIVLSVTDGITTVSAAAASRLTQTGISPDLLHVIPNGVDPQKYYPRSRAERCAVAAAHFAEDDPWEVWPLIGSAGNLRPVKSFESLINVMPGILHKWPRARLIIWGEGPERERLQQMARQLGVDHAIRFAGRTEHLEKLLPLLDLYVQPSAQESFGLAPAEAMCCGIPTIVSDAGGLPELADHGRAARVFPVKNHAELARQIIVALDDKRLLKKQGSAGRGWILQNYTAQQMVRRMASLYCELVQDSSNTTPRP